MRASELINQSIKRVGVGVENQIKSNRWGVFCSLGMMRYLYLAVFEGRVQAAAIIEAVIYVWHTLQFYFL